eukprot:scaffold1888_cov79-Isochrysis_galbana.AAC.3
MSSFGAKRSDMSSFGAKRSDTSSFGAKRSDTSSPRSPGARWSSKGGGSSKSGVGPRNVSRGGSERAWAPGRAAHAAPGVPPPLCPAPLCPRPAPDAPLIPIPAPAPPAATVAPRPAPSSSTRWATAAAAQAPSPSNRWSRRTSGCHGGGSGGGGGDHPRPSPPTPSSASAGVPSPSAHVSAGVAAVAGRAAEAGTPRAEARSRARRREGGGWVCRRRVQSVHRSSCDREASTSASNWGRAHAAVGMAWRRNSAVWLQQRSVPTPAAAPRPTHEGVHPRTRSNCPFCCPRFCCPRFCCPRFCCPRFCCPRFCCPRFCRRPATERSSKTSMVAVAEASSAAPGAAWPAAAKGIPPAPPGGGLAKQTASTSRLSHTQTGPSTVVTEQGPSSAEMKGGLSRAEVEEGASRALTEPGACPAASPTSPGCSAAATPPGFGGMGGGTGGAGRAWVCTGKRGAAAGGGRRAGAGSLQPAPEEGAGAARRVSAFATGSGGVRAATGAGASIPATKSSTAVPEARVQSMTHSIAPPSPRGIWLDSEFCVKAGPGVSLGVRCKTTATRAPVGWHASEQMGPEPGNHMEVHKVACSTSRPPRDVNPIQPPPAPLPPPPPPPATVVCRPLCVGGCPCTAQKEHLPAGVMVRTAPSVWGGWPPGSRRRGAACCAAAPLSPPARRVTSPTHSIPWGATGRHSLATPVSPRKANPKPPPVSGAAPPPAVLRPIPGPSPPPAVSRPRRVPPASSAHIQKVSSPPGGISACAGPPG